MSLLSWFSAPESEAASEENFDYEWAEFNLPHFNLGRTALHEQGDADWSENFHLQIENMEQERE